jgi:flagellar basal body-associated protein FliL
VKRLLAALAIAAAAAGGAAAALVLRGAGGPHAAVPDREAVVELPELTVNLAGTDGYSYLRVQVAVAVRGPLAQEALTQAVEARKAALLDALNTLAQRTTFTQLRSGPGQRGFDAQLRDRFDALLAPARVRVERIYFEELVAE